MLVPVINQLIQRLRGLCGFFKNDFLIPRLIIDDTVKYLFISVHLRLFNLILLPSNDVCVRVC